MTINSFLKDLESENGFKFGTPWRYSDKTLGVVVPILKIGDAGEREYITLEEAKDQGIDIKDSGHIDKVIIESSLSIPIFIRSGTVFKSEGTQPRAAESSIVIIQQEENVKDKTKEGVKDKTKEGVKDKTKEKVKQEIPVRCIYASKPIHTNATFSVGGDVPLEVRSSLLSRSGQASTWAAVGHSTYRLMSTRLGSSGAHAFGSGLGSYTSTDRDDLAGIMEDVDKFKDNVNKILENIPLFEDQVGAVFLDMKEVIGLEMFTHPKSWEAIHKEVEKRLGESIAKEEDKTFFKPDYEQVKPLTFGFIKKLIDSEKVETSKGEDCYSVTFLKGEGVVGEATSINGKVIHLVGIKIDKASKDSNVHSSIRRTSSDGTSDDVTSRVLRRFSGPRTGSYRSTSDNVSYNL